MMDLGPPRKHTGRGRFKQTLLGILEGRRKRYRLVCLNKKDLNVPHLVELHLFHIRDAISRDQPR